LRRNSLTKEGIQNSGEEKPLKFKSPINPKPHTLTKENFYKRTLVLLEWLPQKLLYGSSHFGLKPYVSLF
jgi:hypothetical protein